MDILIVDDDARIVELVAWFLDQRGYRVRRASSFAEARSHLTERRPDLMLSDIDLGAEDGREELWAIAREGGLPPTLVVSGYLSPEVLAELEGLPGLVGTLPKPFDFEVLEAQVRSALASRGAGADGNPVAGQARGPAVVHGAPLDLGNPADPMDPGPAREDEDGWIEIRPGFTDGVDGARAGASPGPSDPMGA